jgi:ABC-type amino acid transport system permease subunit
MTIEPSVIFLCLVSAFKHLPITLMLTVVPLMLDVFIGALVALMRVNRIRGLSRLLDALITVFKGIPDTLIIVVMGVVVSRDYTRLTHWTPLINKGNINNIVAIIALTLAYLPMISESFRGALLSVERSQYEAAMSVGLTTAQTYWRIILPQTWLAFLPPLVGNALNLFKGTALAFMIGVTDAYNGAMIVASKQYAILEGYIAIALLYWAISALLTAFGNYLETRISQAY